MNPLYTFVIGLGLGAVAIFYAITHWNNVKLFFSDTLRLFGFFSKWIRKKSVEEKYEAVINSAIDDYNSNFEYRILPGCRVNWIVDDSDESYLEDNRAIVCLKFDKKDEDLNFYNAAYSFTKTGLLPKTRNFIKASSQKAIDLNLTKIILKNFQRRSLRVFNEKFKNEDELVKDSFERLEQTEKRGLFRSLLIPELHFLGEILETTTPNRNIETEIEKFLDWFHDLATRERFENTSLHYQSPNLKVGVILVANLETYENYGTEAYTKWAEKYASENYGAIYLLARGVNRNKILREIVDELTTTRGFDQINKKVSAFQLDETGDQVEIFCYSLKANIAKVQYQAWEKLKECFEKGKLVSGIVKIVEGDGLIVNAYGRDIKISKEKLSAEKIVYVRKYFKPEHELLLRIESFDYEDGEISLSNVGTETDPKIIIDNTLEDNKAFEVNVDSVQYDEEGREKGLRTYCKEINRRVFIPKSKCSYSRFINLENLFKKGDKLNVTLHAFGYQFGNFIGELEGLLNPWLKIKEFSEGEIYKSVIQEVNKIFITTEFISGLECRIYRNELSWDGSLNPETLKVGEEVETYIIRIDSEKYWIFGSLKRIEKSKNQKYYETKGTSAIKARVSRIIEGIGLEFKSNDGAISGFVHISELIWGFCNDIESIFPLKSEISVRAINYEFNDDKLHFSIKRCIQNDFDKVIKTFDKSLSYDGQILKYIGDICRVELIIGNNKLQGYVHKSEVSGRSYIKSDDFEIYLPIHETFSFRIKKVNKKNKILELSRRAFLASVPEIEDYGTPIKVKVVRREFDCAFVYSNTAEGRIIDNYEKLAVGTELDVYPINNNGEFQI